MVDQHSAGLHRMNLPHSDSTPAVAVAAVADGDAEHAGDGCQLGTAEPSAFRAPSDAFPLPRRTLPPTFRSRSSSLPASTLAGMLLRKYKKKEIYFKKCNHLINTRLVKDSLPNVYKTSIKKQLSGNNWSQTCA